MKTVIIIVALLGLVASALAIIETKDDKLEAMGFELADIDYSEKNKIPKSINWTALHAVSPAVAEGPFRNSWAFAIAGVMESRHYIVHKKMRILSKQNLVDCCQPRNKTEDHLINGLLCLIDQEGIETEAAYPYKGPIGKCQFDKTKIGATVKQIFHVEPGSETTLKYFVAKGPLVTSIPYKLIQTYKSGVIQMNCDMSKGMYSVLIVGYGISEKDGKYWILKTSMGSKWGEGGYMRLARRSKKMNECSITDWVFYPQVL